MKVIKYFQIFLFSLMLVFIASSCEKTEIQKSAETDTEKILPRVPCNQCPDAGDCCGAISYVSGAEIIIEICGTSDGDVVECSDDHSGCETIDGLLHSSVTLNSTNPIYFFCIPKNKGFIVKAITVMGTTNLNITTQYGQLSPQSINFQFTAVGPRFFETNGSCEIASCD